MKSFFETFEIVSSSKEPTGYDDNKPAFGFIFIDAEMSQQQDPIEITKFTYDAAKKADWGDNSTNDSNLQFSYQYKLPGEIRFRDIGYYYHKIFEPTVKFKDPWSYTRSEKLEDFMRALNKIAKYYNNIYNKKTLSSYQIKGGYRGNGEKSNMFFNWTMPTKNQRNDDDDRDNNQNSPMPPSPKYPSSKINPVLAL